MKNGKNLKKSGKKWLILKLTNLTFLNNLNFFKKSNQIIINKI